MKNMIKKEILKNYIDGLNHQNECDNKFHDVLKFIHPDNYNISLVSEKYSMAMEALVEEFIGPIAFDFLQWWLWETNVGIGDNKFRVDPFIFDKNGDTTHTLDTFDKLYDYLISLDDAEVSVTEMFEKVTSKLAPD